MKIALCISGEMRNFQDPLINDSIQKTIEDLDCDLFISTWSHNGESYNKLDINILEKKKATDIELISSIKSTYGERLRSLEVEDYNEWLDLLDPAIINMMSTRLITGEAVTSPPQLYKIYRCNRLKSEYEKNKGFQYDACIRSRPDLIFMSTPIMEKLDHINNINFGISGAYWPNRVFDIFFYSSNMNMNVLSNSWESIIDDVKYNLDNGLDPRDACRLIYINAIKNNIPVNDMNERICAVYRGEYIDIFNDEINRING
jgi:hypothetical protein